MPDHTLFLDIEPKLAAPMRLRVALPGDSSHFAPPSVQAQPTVHIEFYDRSFMQEPGFPPYGQFIRSLPIENVINRQANTPLVLNSLVPQWWIDAATMQQVQTWAKEQQSANL